MDITRNAKMWLRVRDDSGRREIIRLMSLYAARSPDTIRGRMPKMKSRAVEVKKSFPTSFRLPLRKIEQVAWNLFSRAS